MLLLWINWTPASCTAGSARCYRHHLKLPRHLSPPEIGRQAYSGVERLWPLRPPHARRRRALRAQTGPSQERLWWLRCHRPTDRPTDGGGGGSGAAGPPQPAGWLRERQPLAGELQRPIKYLYGGTASPNLRLGAAAATEAARGRSRAGSGGQTAAPLQKRRGRHPPPGRAGAAAARGRRATGYGADATAAAARAAEGAEGAPAGRSPLPARGRGRRLFARAGAARGEAPAPALSPCRRRRQPCPQGGSAAAVLALASSPPRARRGCALRAPSKARGGPAAAGGRWAVTES